MSRPLDLDALKRELQAHRARKPMLGYYGEGIEITADQLEALIAIAESPISQEWLAAHDSMLVSASDYSGLKAEARRLREALEWIVTYTESHPPMSLKGLRDGARAALEGARR